jgi:hypothetical protein
VQGDVEQQRNAESESDPLMDGQAGELKAVVESERDQQDQVQPEVELSPARNPTLLRRSVVGNVIGRHGVHSVGNQKSLPEVIDIGHCLLDQLAPVRRSHGVIQHLRDESGL